jgi:glycine cleavage system H protein
MKFTESHEWVDLGSDNNTATVGVTNFAQKELGEVVYVELPEIGKEVKAGSEVAVLESTKAAADVYAPVSGTIVDVNKRLTTTSELVNQSPEKDGWIFKIKLNNLSELDKLLDTDAYLAKIK